MNYETVKLFASEDVERGRLSTVLDKWVDARTANQRALTILHVGQSTVIALGIAAVMLLAAQNVVAGTMSVGDLVLVNAYIVQVCAPLNTLGFVFREASDALVNTEKLFALLDMPAEIVDRLGRFAQLGADTAYLQIQDMSDLDQLEVLAAEVLPQLSDSGR